MYLLYVRSTVGRTARTGSSKDNAIKPREGLNSFIIVGSFEALEYIFPPGSAASFGGSLNTTLAVVMAVLIHISVQHPTHSAWP